jgi:hypothetical protein
MKMIDMLMAYEAGDLNEEKTVELFQNLIDSGLIFGLQGSYMRTARELVEAGLIDLSTGVNED